MNLAIEINKKERDDIGVELKTISDEVYRLAIVRGYKNREYFTFVGEDKDTFVNIYSGGISGCGISYKDSLIKNGITFIKFYQNK